MKISFMVRSICGLVVLVCAGSLFGAERASLTINDVSVSEGDHGVVVAVFTVSLSVASEEEVLVRYATVDGSAKAGAEYTSVGGTLRFATGDTAKQIVVLVTSDLIAEDAKEFFVQLSDAHAASLSSIRGTGTIIDDDGSGAGK